MAITQSAKRMTPGEQQEVASRQWDRYIRARDNGHLEYIETAKKCDAYYRGDQWDEADLSALEAQGRPALTINTILPTVNTVLGEQSTRRADVRFKPRRNGDSDVANTLTKLYMQVADNNKLDWVEQQVFSDGLIMDGRDSLTFAWTSVTMWKAKFGSRLKIRWTCLSIQMPRTTIPKRGTRSLKPNG